MVLYDYLRALKASKSDHRAHIGNLLETMTKRCMGVSLDPAEERVISEVVSEFERKMQRTSYTPTYGDLLPLATWLNISLAH